MTNHISSAAEAARENARTAGGQFGEQHRADAGQLGLADEIGWSQQQLRQRCARFGIDADQVPGLVEAWQQQFGVVDAEPPTHINRRLARIVGDTRAHTFTLVAYRDGSDPSNPEFRYLAAGEHPEPGERFGIHTIGSVPNDRMRERDGWVGGTDRHWTSPHGAGREPVGSHLFRMPDDQVDNIDGWWADTAVFQRRQEAAMRMQRFEAKDVPPWAVLADQQQVDDVMEQMNDNYWLAHLRSRDVQQPLTVDGTIVTEQHEQARQQFVAGRVALWKAGWPDGTDQPDPPADWLP